MQRTPHMNTYLNCIWSSWNPTLTTGKNFFGFGFSLLPCSHSAGSMPAGKRNRWWKWPSVCLSVSISMYLYVPVATYLYWSLSTLIDLYQSLSINPSTEIYTYFFIYLYLFTYIYIYTYLSISIPVYISIPVDLHLSIYIYLYQYISLSSYSYIYISLCTYIGIYLSIYLSACLCLPFSGQETEILRVRCKPLGLLVAIRQAYKPTPALFQPKS